MTKKTDTREIDSLYVEGIGEVRSGMVLEHPKFGLGVVEGIFEWVGTTDKTIRLNFKGFGSKALAPEFAKLSIPKQKVKAISLLNKIFSKGR